MKLLALALLFSVQSWSVPQPGHIPASLRSSVGRPQLVRELIFFETLKWLRPEKKFLALEITSSVIASAARHALDPVLLLAMIIQESGVRPDARGRHGEVGLMQLRLTTAQWVARRLHRRPPNVDQLFRPELNVELGAAYLAYLRDYTGPERFIQAYNSGPAAIRRAQTTDYVDRISKHYRTLLQALAVTDEPSFASLESDVEPGIRAQDSTLTPIAERSGKGSRIP